MRQDDAEEESATAVVVEEEDTAADALFGFDAVSVDEDSDDMDSSSWLAGQRVSSEKHGTFACIRLQCLSG